MLDLLSATCHIDRYRLYLAIRNVFQRTVRAKKSQDDELDGYSLTGTIGSNLVPSDRSLWRASSQSVALTESSVVTLTTSNQLDFVGFRLLRHAGYSRYPSFVSV